MCTECRLVWCSSSRTLLCTKIAAWLCPCFFSGPRHTCLAQKQRGQSTQMGPSTFRAKPVVHHSGQVGSCRCGIRDQDIFGDRQRCILRLGASLNFSTRGQILLNYYKNPPAQRPDGPLCGGDFGNKLEESSLEWRNSKKPLIEEYKFADPRKLVCLTTFRAMPVVGLSGE